MPKGQSVRIVLVIAAMATPMLVGAPASQAYYEGPWCAVSNIGHDVTWNCSMRSLEMCREEVIAGNRGWCNPNPRWGGAVPAESRPSRKRSGY